MRNKWMVVGNKHKNSLVYTLFVKIVLVFMSIEMSIYGGIYYILGLDWKSIMNSISISWLFI